MLAWASTNEPPWSLSDPESPGRWVSANPGSCDLLRSVEEAGAFRSCLCEQSQTPVGEASKGLEAGVVSSVWVCIGVCEMCFESGPRRWTKDRIQTRRYKNIVSEFQMCGKTSPGPMPATSLLCPRQGPLALFSAMISLPGVTTACRELEPILWGLVTVIRIRDCWGDRALATQTGWAV